MPGAVVARLPSLAWQTAKQALQAGHGLHQAALPVLADIAGGAESMAEQWDAYAESTGALALQDEIGHGTHVASTVGGDGSLSASQGGPDLAGVAPGVEFISMRVATPGFGIVDDIDWEEAALAAFDWTIRHRKEFGPFILINTNFGVTNSAKGPPEAVVRALVRGTAINQDGRGTSLTAPNPGMMTGP